MRSASPIAQVRLRDGRRPFLITRYEDVAGALRDERLAKDPRAALTPEQQKKEPWMPAMFRPLTRNMLDLDGADHARLRALVQKAFTPQRVEAIRPRVAQLAEGLLDEAGGEPVVDLVRRYALPIPTTVIAEMLGVPAADRHRFHRWSAAIVSAGASTPGMLRAFPSVWSFLRYLRRLVEARQAAPGDDLLGALVQVEEAGERLSRDELLAMIFLLLVAGHETTVNFIGNATLALLENPGELERLRQDLGLIEPAVEELLRYAGPLETATERYAREDLKVGGVTIPRGSVVLAILASANRDEARFTSPDRLDLSRAPGRHLAFGLGIHYCLGAPLARLEAQVALATLLRRAPGLALATPTQRLRWRRGLVLRGLEALPVRLQSPPEGRRRVV